MYPAPNFNPLLPFTVTKELPYTWKQYLLSYSNYTLYSASTCDILIQKLYLDNQKLWYLIFNVTEDDQLLKLVLAPNLAQLLIYIIRNDDEMIFLHQDMGLGISEQDYCYLGGGFCNRDLRVLVSKGSYHIVVFPFFSEIRNATVTGMTSAETFAFINRNLLAMGITSY
jgi:hypothetical protein